MALTSGTKLGPYEIQSPLGAGGMGEVYRARDTRLDRTVAIKVLPTHLSADPELKQRFDREAKAISALQHPNICTLHDVGSQDGVDFLVMEYLEGQTLADRLVKGALPLVQVLKIGTEIAEALDKAHRQGIIHRDLKPGNIMLTKSGAKLMDFGLAKPTNVGLSAATPLAHSTPTMSMANLSAPVAPLTQQGAVLGTWQYIAPEVLQGREADARSDIFALGGVLYEMATGQHAFEGKTAASVIGAILERDPPPIVRTQPAAPLALDAIVKTCLVKDPDERWQSAHDVKVQLRWLGSEGAKAGTSEDAEQNVRSARMAWALTVIASALAVVFAIGDAWRKPTEARSIRAEINPRSEQQFGEFGPTNSGFAISPDGTKLVYSAKLKGVSALWLRNLDQETSQQLPGTEEGAFPFWSPDGQKIGFFGRSKLKTLTLGSNNALEICDAVAGRGGTWSRNGVIVFTPGINLPLFAVSESGGVPHAVTELDHTRVYSQRWPFFLPDGDHFLFLTVLNSSLTGSVADTGQGSIQVGSLSHKESKELLTMLSPAEFAAGYLLYTRPDNVLVAQKFNPDRLQLSGDPIPIAPNVLRMPTLFRTFFSVSSAGVLTYSGGSDAFRPPPQSLIVTDRKGNKLTSVAEEVLLGTPRFSPDGNQILFTNSNSASIGHNLWVYDLTRGIKAPVTAGDKVTSNSDAVWSSDGRRIAFTKYGPGKYSIQVKNADGSGPEQVVMDDDIIPIWPRDWSSDQKYLALVTGTSFLYNKVEFLDMQGGTAKPFSAPSIGSGEGNRNPRFSPDGKWVAYSSNESGQSQIMVTSFPGTTGRWQVSTDGGSSPAWRGDGGELFYVSPSPDNWFMSVDVTKKGAGINFGKPQKLFQMAAASGGSPYDVSRDGKKFAIVSAGNGPPAPIILVTNWTAEWKK
jgi:eukaryotic-like serine/threonine-protein kinase